MEHDYFSTLNKCEDFPKENNRFYDHPEHLGHFFQFYGVLGAGVSGVVVKAGRDDKIFAIKCIPEDDDTENEIFTTCEINNLQEKTPIFNKIHGYVRLKHLPKIYFMGIFKLYPLLTHARILIVQEMNTGHLDDIQWFHEKELKVVWFILLHGIMIARKYLGYFYHRDIHIKNVMLKPFSSALLRLEEDKFELKGVRFIPKLIDFGQSYTKSWQHKDTSQDLVEFVDNKGNVYPPRNDIKRLYLLIKSEYERSEFSTKRLEDFAKSAMYDAAILSKPHEFNEILNLLHNPFFADIVEITTFLKIPKECPSCTICGNIDVKYQSTSNKLHKICGNRVCYQEYIKLN